MRCTKSPLVSMLWTGAVLAGCAGKTGTQPNSALVNGEPASQYYGDMTYGQDNTTHFYRVLTADKVSLKAVDATTLLFANMRLQLLPTNQFRMNYSECTAPSPAAACTQSGQKAVNGAWAVAGDTIVLDHIGTGVPITANGAPGFAADMVEAFLAPELVGTTATFTVTLSPTPFN